MASALAPQLQSTLQVQMLLLQLFGEILHDRTRDSPLFEESERRVDEAQQVLHHQFKHFYEERKQKQEDELNSALSGLSKFLVDSQLYTNSNWNPKTSRNRKGQTTLHIAAMRNVPLPVLRLLMDTGASPDAPDLDLNTPLHAAAERGSVSAVEALLAAGATIDKKNRNGRTPLYAAAVKGHDGAVRALLRHGADVHTEDSARNFPLREAARMNHVCVLEALLGAGADVNRRNGNNSTALHEAAHHSKLEAVQLLVQRGADVAAVDKFRDTPVRLARKPQISEFFSKPELWVLPRGGRSCPV